MEFFPKKEYCCVVEKKNAIGLWGKKFFVFKDLVVCVYDSEKERGGSPSLTFSLVSFSKIDDVLELKGKRESVGLRFEESESWSTLFAEALSVKQRQKGVPVVDPRFGLKIVEIPAEFVSKFSNLDKAVLYWFSPVKKFGSPSKFTGKLSIEDRVSFCGDKAFYVTKSNGEVTRCVKIQKLKAVFTNVGLTSCEEPFVVLKFSAPEYDVCLSAISIELLVSSLQAIFFALEGVQLVVNRCALMSEIELQLERPSNFSMTMVLPTTKEQLKKALADFGKKHQISFSSEGAARAEVRVEEKNGLATPIDSAPSSRIITDPLECFLVAVGCQSRFSQLYGQNVDMDILECMDETDLRTYGVTDPEHIGLILRGLRDEGLMQKVREDVNAARTGWSSPQKLSGTTGPARIVPQILLDSDDEGAETRRIELDSDDDLDAVIASKRVPVVLDDDDL